MAAVAALLAFGVAAPVIAAPIRVASINVCADQLLLALADRDQIATLSVFAADPSLSFLAAEAKDLPHTASSAESVIGLKPDLVLAGSFTKTATRDMLRRLGFPLVELSFVRSVDQGIDEIRRVAALLGHPERGEALIADIEAARREAMAGATPGRLPSVAVYQRRGYVTGGMTLTGDLLGLAGFENQGGTLAGRSGGFVPLEKLLTTPPDLIVVASADPKPQDEGSALLAHPALRALYPPERRIVLPDQLTVCGGPSLPAAIRYLAGEAKRVRAASGS